jgi:sugar transferase EpsL
MPWSAQTERRIMTRVSLKRIADLIVASTMLVVASLIILCTAVIVAILLGRPVIFRQQRAGRYGKSFTIFKFRTMTDAKGPDGNLLPDGQRLSRIGSLLRSTSLDELPQLWNVVKGEMSLIGPRPLLARWIDFDDPSQTRRLDARPGITGLAQINGRNSLTYPQRFAYDAWYIDNWSPKLDAFILVQTVKVVLARSGSGPKGEAEQVREEIARAA